MITSKISSLARQAQARTKACHYHDMAARSPERTTHGCGYVLSDSCAYCDDFPGAEWEAETERLDARRDKALARVGDHAAVLAAIQGDPAVMAAARRTVRLLGADAVTVHAFGPGWREIPQVAVGEVRVRSKTHLSELAEFVRLQEAP